MPRRTMQWTWLAILAALAGAAIGWFVAPAPLYRCEAAIYVSPTIPTRNPPEAVLVEFEARLDSMMALLNSKSVLGQDISPERVRVTRERGAHHIRIEFMDADPDAARIGLETIVGAFSKLVPPLPSEVHGDHYMRVRDGRERCWAETERIAARILELPEDDPERAELEKQQALVSEELAALNRAFVDLNRGFRWQLISGPNKVTPSRTRDHRPLAALIGAVAGLLCFAGFRVVLMFSAAGHPSTTE